MHPLKKYLKSKKIKTTDFAKKVNVSPEFFYMIFNGSRKPHPETAIAIEKATDGEIKKEWLVFPEAYEEEIRAYIEDRKPVGVEK